MSTPADDAAEDIATRRTARSPRHAKSALTEQDPNALFEGLGAVDTEKIQGLYHVFSPGDFRNLMEMVHRCIVTETDRVEEAVAEHNYSAAMIAAHKITGSSGNYAFIRVSKAAARVNDLLNNGAPADKALQELRTEADRAVADLKALLDRLS